MLRNFNDLCGSCVTVFMYATVGTLGVKTGLHLYDKIKNKIEK